MLRDLGVSRNQSSLWQRVAKLSPQAFELRIMRMRKRADQLSRGLSTSSFLDTAFSPASDEWMTPPEVLDLVVELFRVIDLDPCAERSDAKANVPAGAHFTKAENGLAKLWQGTVFMNPPYGDAVKSWVEKLLASHIAATVHQAIALLPGRIDTDWFAMFARGTKAPVCFVDGRLTFRGDGGGWKAPFPSAIFYLGPSPRRFATIFSRLGRIYAPLESGGGA